jgi:hypothetical protein
LTDKLICLLFFPISFQGIIPAPCIPDNDKNERKNPFRKKGNVWQSRRTRSYKIQSMKTQQHQNANIGAGSILQAVASDAKTKSPKSATTTANFFYLWQTPSKVSMALKSKKQ